MNIQRQRDILDKTKRAAYLASLSDAEGCMQARVRRLSGHAEGTAKLIDALPFVRPYQSLCMSFAREDHPTQQQVDAAASDLLNILLAGLWPGRIDPLVYERALIDGRIDVHFVIPRVDLLTGRAFNPTPPLVRPLLKLVEQYLAAREGWSSPNHPLRHRLLVPIHGRRRSDDPNSIAAWSARKSESIAKIVGMKVESGEFKSRADVISYFQRINALANTSTTGIVTKWTHSDGKEYPITLCGKLFSDSFNPDEIKAKLRADRDGTPLLGIKDPEFAQVCKDKLDAITAARAESNRRTYAVGNRIGRYAAGAKRPIIPIGSAGHLLSAKQQGHAAGVVESLLRTVPRCTPGNRAHPQ